MKSSTLALAAQLVTLGCSFKLVKRENPRVVKADLHRRHVNPLDHDRLRRRDTVQVSLDNLETLYFMNASLGTPAQNFRLHIDTGSSDLWVNAANSALCSNRALPCDAAGVYNANDSSTYEYVNSIFNISYVDGSGASGDYAKDTFNMNNVDINRLQFGIGYESSSPEGILGIGYMVNEVQVNRARLDPYSNLPQKLVDDNKINTNAYSLWLNDLDASTGSILFGGVDTDKFEGTLSKLPIIPESGVYAEFIIALTSLGADGKKGSIFENEQVAVLLDSGSSLMYLPNNVATSLYNKYNARYDSTQGAALVDCDLANQEGSLDFTFSQDGPTISVPLNELVLLMGYQRGQPVCILGIGPAGDSVSVLGDTFLRSAYVVYDLGNNEIALAQTVFNATQSNIQEIQSGDDGVPSATGVSHPVSSLSVQGGGGRINGPSVSGSPDTPNPQSSDSGSPAATPMPWHAAGAAIAGGIMMGFNGF
ncbi:candidapepsin-4 precursor [Bimuria novae-zelandiae CBS 107.79]|uniref:Probable aspartic-type endopeptidase OPSB n=1 Tax=Bimuria novae-zelandiae CBS 107.79 TaxID=1447943 RepID=A0A6A5UR48_9PLEO|nr:candidapepsin-4 precursor [Bimuria novae-zelandiae CBS 107.79]